MPFIFDEDTYLKDGGVTEIAVLNLTFDGGGCERRISKLLEASPLKIEATYVCADGVHTDGAKSFTEIENRYFDGMIVCGEPRCAAFNRFEYWKEFCDIMRWTDGNVAATAFIGWAAQAAAYFFYGVKKHNLKERCYGVFTSCKVPGVAGERLMTGISDEFALPFDHFSYVRAADVMRSADLKIMAYSRRAGATVFKSADGRRLFVTGHPEYDRYALKTEYEKSLESDPKAHPPVNYFTGKGLDVKDSWSSSATLLVLNWLNCCACAVGQDQRLGA